MSKIAIIGGTDLCELKDLKATRREFRTTPYGLSSAPLTYGTLHGRHVVFIARHGDSYTIPSHKINYRANMWALKEAGVDRVIGISVVGGIRSDMTIGRFVIPDQLIDYTYSREHTYYDGEDKEIHHINFSDPFDTGLRKLLINSAEELGLDPSDEACYGVVEGPRLSTTAEVNRMEKDGCDLVGLTLMPEASLAREVDIKYACLCLIAGKASGRDSVTLTLANLAEAYRDSMSQVHALLQHLIQTL